MDPRKEPSGAVARPARERSEQERESRRRAAMWLSSVRARP